MVSQVAQYVDVYARSFLQHENQQPCPFAKSTGILFFVKIDKIPAHTCKFTLACGSTHPTLFIPGGPKKNTPQGEREVGISRIYIYILYILNKIWSGKSLTNVNMEKLPAVQRLGYFPARCRKNVRPWMWCSCFSDKWKFIWFLKREFVQRMTRFTQLRPQERQRGS